MAPRRFLRARQYAPIRGGKTAGQVARALSPPPLPPADGEPMESYKKLQKVTSEGDMLDNSDAIKNPSLPDEKGDLVEECQRLPWETAGEYDKFHAFLFCSEPRSVRKAYRAYCTANGRTPRKNPPSSWYKLYRGEYAALRLAERRKAAIERAEKVHGLVPDWEGVEAAARRTGEIGKYEGEIGEVWDALTLIEWAFWSLGIDLNGDLVRPTWQERCAAKALIDAGYKDFAAVLLSRDAAAIQAAMTPEIEAFMKGT